MHVLVIDDEEEARFVLRISLGQIGGMTVLEAKNGQEGLAVAKAARPDLILLDAAMPRMNGEATFHALRAAEETASIPVVFLSGMARFDEAMRRLESLGAKAVLRKPFDPLRLPYQLRELLEQ